MANKHTWNHYGLGPLCKGNRVFVLDDPETQCRSTVAAVQHGAASVVALSRDSRIEHMSFDSMPSAMKKRIKDTCTFVSAVSTRFIENLENDQLFDVVFLDYCATPKRPNSMFDWKRDVEMLLDQHLAPKGSIFLTFSKRNMSNVSTFVINTVHQIDGARFVDMYEYSDTSPMVLLSVCRGSDWTCEEPPRVSSAFVPEVGETVQLRTDWNDGEVWYARFVDMQSNDRWIVEENGNAWIVYAKEVSRLTLRDENGVLFDVDSRVVNSSSPDADALYGSVTHIDVSSRKVRVVWDDGTERFENASQLIVQLDPFLVGPKGGNIDLRHAKLFSPGTRVSIRGEKGGPNEYTTSWKATVNDGPTYIIRAFGATLYETRPSAMSHPPIHYGESVTVVDDNNTPYCGNVVGGPFWFVRADDGGKTYRVKASEMTIIPKKREVSSHRRRTKTPKKRRRLRTTEKEITGGKQSAHRFEIKEKKVVGDGDWWHRFMSLFGAV